MQWVWLKLLCCYCSNAQKKKGWTQDTHAYMEFYYMQISKAKQNIWNECLPPQAVECMSQVS